MNTKDILELTFKSNDLNRTVTIREWLSELLAALWREGEGFSGKRPLGNSGWELDVVPVLVEYGVISGQTETKVTTTSGADGVEDEDEYIDVINYDSKALNGTIADCIRHLGASPPDDLPWYKPVPILPDIPAPPIDPFTPYRPYVINEPWWATWGTDTTNNEVPNTDGKEPHD